MLVLRYTFRVLIDDVAVMNECVPCGREWGLWTRFYTVALGPEMMNSTPNSVRDSDEEIPYRLGGDGARNAELCRGGGAGGGNSLI